MDMAILAKSLVSIERIWSYIGDYNHIPFIRHWKFLKKINIVEYVDWEVLINIRIEWRAQKNDWQRANRCAQINDFHVGIVVFEGQMGSQRDESRFHWIHTHRIARMGPSLRLCERLLLLYENSQSISVKYSISTFYEKQIIIWFRFVYIFC